MTLCEIQLNINIASFMQIKWFYKRLFILFNIINFLGEQSKICQYSADCFSIHYFCHLLLKVSRNIQLFRSPCIFSSVFLNASVSTKTSKWLQMLTVNLLVICFLVIWSSRISYPSIYSSLNQAHASFPEHCQAMSRHETNLFLHR